MCASFVDLRRFYSLKFARSIVVMPYKRGQGLPDAQIIYLTKTFCNF